MECQECYKRPASVHFTQVINGNKTEVHVCEVCAKEKGYMMYSEEGYSLHNLLSGLFNFESASFGKADKAVKQTKEYQCPQCKMSFSDFKRTGKFGCATCYHTFSMRLDPIFRRVHSGNTKHDGKIPKRQGGDLHVKKQIKMYKEEMKQLVENEAFEEAAEIRDKIKKLEKQAGKPEDGDES